MDKLWGLGFATEAGKSWLDGASPTSGFLNYATQGPFADFFQGMAGSAFVDWVFMIGLLLLGLSLIFGIGVRIAGHAGALLMLLMWLAVLPPEHNPFMDEHLIQLVVLLGIAHVGAGQWFGLGKWWKNTSLVKSAKWLE